MEQMCCLRLTDMTPSTPDTRTHRNLQCGHTLLVFLTIWAIAHKRVLREDKASGYATVRRGRTTIQLHDVKPRANLNAKVHAFHIIAPLS